MKASDETSALETEAAASAATVSPPRNLFRPQTFKALHYRNFALLWGGMLLSNTGTWMQIMAQSLLVLQLTQNSGVALGGNLVCPGLAVLNIFTCRWRRGRQGGQATVVVSHAKPTKLATRLPWGS